MEKKRANPDLAALPLRERNKQRIHQRIEDAAFALFRQVGYEQTTMDLIAEQAEVSRGTLFNYFPSKQTLLLPFVNDIYNQYVQPQLLSHLETQTTALATFRLLFLSIYEHILAYPDIEKALQWEFFHLQRQERDFQKGTGFLLTLLMIIQYGQRQGEIRLDLPAETLAHYVGAMYISLLYQVMGKLATTSYMVEIEKLLTFLQTALRT
jgi:AcrR family transcriptional regulator